MYFRDEDVLTKNFYMHQKVYWMFLKKLPFFNLSYFKSRNFYRIQNILDTFYIIFWTHKNLFIPPNAGWLKFWREKNIYFFDITHFTSHKDSKQTESINLKTNNFFVQKCKINLHFWVIMNFYESKIWYKRISKFLKSAEISDVAKVST